MLDEDHWDEYVEQVQFAINNVPSETTDKTASELMFNVRL